MSCHKVSPSETERVIDQPWIIVEPMLATVGLASSIEGSHLLRKSHRNRAEGLLLKRECFHSSRRRYIGMRNFVSFQEKFFNRLAAGRE